MMQVEGVVAHIRVTAQNLIDISEKEVSLIPSLKKISKELISNLEMTNKFLNYAEKRASIDNNVKFWLMVLQDLLFYADGIVECLNNHRLLSRRIDTNPIMTKASTRCVLFFGIYKWERRIAQRIGEFNKNLRNIVREGINLKLDQPGFIQLNGIFSNDQFFVKRNEDMVILVDIFTRTSQKREREFSMCAIVGMGGIGKTTLTLQIFNYEDIVNCFQSRIWVCVSQEFDPLIIFKDILTQLNWSNAESESREVTLTRLSEALKEKTYLLVLDDLWNVDQLIWNNFMNDLSRVTSTKGNVIVVTTRMKAVALAVRPIYIHSMKGLSEEECWSLLKTTSFVGDDLNRVGDDLSRIPEKEARFLLTLTIKVEITDTMLSRFISLRTLKLECAQVRELPSSVKRMIHLEILDISVTSIECLPDWIYGLYYLQTFNASTKSLKELPLTFNNLTSLRKLYIFSGVKVHEIGRLSNLQEVKFTVSDEKGYTIKELGSLKNLEELDIYNVEKVCDEEEARKAKLFEKENLKVLQLEWDANREGETNDESVMEGLQPHPDLKTLVIKGFRGKRFPSWTLTVPDKHDKCWGGFNYLNNITLGGCQRCQEFPTLGRLPRLKSLQLWSVRNVKSISTSFCNIDSSTNGAIFPRLENIVLSNMPELEELAEEKVLNGVEVFPRLQSLKVFHCNNLERLPSSLFRVARSLSELDIRRCSKLRQLSDGQNHLNGFKSITIKGCPNLKSIAGDFSCLNSLEIRDCPELLEIVESDAPSAKKVCMAGLNSLRNLPKLIDILAKSDSLEELTIVGIRKFKSSSSIEKWPFSKLCKLEMDVSRDEWSSVSVEDIRKTVDGVLKSCGSSLYVLKLTGIQSWDSFLPIQHLTGLNSLDLENLGVKELPEWLKDFKSLTRLCLSNCTQLKCLPSLDTMESLTKLQELRIRDCPELRIGSERYKIRHVRNIYFNGYSI